MSIQIKDKIRYQGKDYSISEEPLSRIVHGSDIRLDNGNTANRRGYTCIWKIENDSLYLNNLDSTKLSLLELFNTKEPILASWYTGELTLLDGYSVDFDGFPEYNSKIVLTIVAGKVF